MIWMNLTTHTSEIPDLFFSGRYQVLFRKISGHPGALLGISAVGDP
jgi:hypothetical protein